MTGVVCASEQTPRKTCVFYKRHTRRLKWHHICDIPPFLIKPSQSTYAIRPNMWRKHLPSIGMVLLLHGILLWLIQSGLARQAITLTQESVEALLLTDAAPPPPPVAAPKTPPPKTPLPPVNQPPIATATPVITTPTAPAISNTAPVSPTQSTAPPTPSPSIRTGAVIQPGASCAKPDYPSASRRLEEEGTVGLKFLIGANGRVIQAEIEKTSGFPRLDEAARNALSKCQFRPGSIDGKAEQSWASIKYTWRLE